MQSHARWKVSEYCGGMLGEWLARSNSREVPYVMICHESVSGEFKEMGPTPDVNPYEGFT